MKMVTVPSTAQGQLRTVLAVERKLLTYVASLYAALDLSPHPRIAGHYMFRIGNAKPLAVLGGGVDPKYPRTLIYLGIPINLDHAPCH